MLEIYALKHLDLRVWTSAFNPLSDGHTPKLDYVPQHLEDDAIALAIAGIVAAKEAAKAEAIAKEDALAEQSRIAAAAKEDALAEQSRIAAAAKEEALAEQSRIAAVAREEAIAEQSRIAAVAKKEALANQARNAEADALAQALKEQISKAAAVAERVRLYRAQFTAGEACSLAARKAEVARATEELINAAAAKATATTEPRLIVDRECISAAEILVALESRDVARAISANESMPPTVLADRAHVPPLLDVATDHATLPQGQQTHFPEKTKQTILGEF